MIADNATTSSALMIATPRCFKGLKGLDDLDDLSRFA
jgi:hypothetical protein